jgi:hypothetical protein
MDGKKQGEIEIHPNDYQFQKLFYNALGCKLILKFDSRAVA